LRIVTRFALAPIVYGIKYPYLPISLLAVVGSGWYIKRRDKNQLNP